MTTLIVSLQGMSPMHQATEAEIIYQRLQQGHRVEVVHCSACLRTCSLNSTHNLIGCAVCDARSVHTARKLGVSYRALDASMFPSQYTGSVPTQLDELLLLEYEGINIGRGVVSSSISILREYHLDPQGEHYALLELELCNAIGALRNYQQLLDELHPSEVVLFNGRHSELWPMLELCRQRGIDYICHERGGSVQRYQEFRNSLPHSIATRQYLMDELWEATPVGERERLATAWYEQKRRGATSDDRSYLQGMDRGSLPPTFDGGKHNIVIFTSSEDEMQAIAEWTSPLFKHQNDVIIDLLRATYDRDDLHIYVRMHPNLAAVDNTQTQEVYALSQANLTVLLPDDPVDTYALCDQADVVLTFVSTIGIEATYWGTASVLYGRAFYEGLDAVYQPQSFADLLRTLTTPGLPPRTRDRALKYGLFVSHFGELYQYARVDGPKSAYIGGEKLKRLTPRALQNLLRFLPQLPRWLRTHRIVAGRRLRLSELTKLYSHLREKA